MISLNYQDGESIIFDYNYTLALGYGSPSAPGWLWCCIAGLGRSLKHQNHHRLRLAKLATISQPLQSLPGTASLRCTADRSKCPKRSRFMLITEHVCRDVALFAWAEPVSNAPEPPPAPILKAGGYVLAVAVSASNSSSELLTGLGFLRISRFVLVSGASMHPWGLIN